MEVYIGYNKDDFFYSLINGNNDKYSKNILSEINKSDINPTDKECKKLLSENWTDMSCTYYFLDNSTNCIKNEICENKLKANKIEDLDINHKPKYERNIELDEEFKNTILDTVNLSLGILFVIIVIFKLTSMVRKQK